MALVKVGFYVKRWTYSGCKFAHVITIAVYKVKWTKMYWTDIFYEGSGKTR